MEGLNLGLNRGVAWLQVVGEGGIYIYEQTLIMIKILFTNIQAVSL